MVANLKAGHLDGFCAGQPWNSEAVADGCGWIAATSASLEGLHPEKVLVATEEFERRRHGDHVALIAALIEACAHCDDPANHGAIAALLARREYLNLPAAAVRRSWMPSVDRGHGQTVTDPDFAVFHRHEANEPSADKAGWIVNNLLEAPMRPLFPSASFAKVFRPDLHAEARALLLPFPSRTDARPEHETEPVTAGASVDVRGVRPGQEVPAHTHPDGQDT
jgi:hypothetical protein